MKFDDLARLSPVASWRLPESDADPQETREWLDALDAVIAAEGSPRATVLLQKLVQHARRRRVQLPTVADTLRVTRRRLSCSNSASTISFAPGVAHPTQHAGATAT